MKQLVKFFTIFIIGLMVVSCGSGEAPPPEGGDNTTDAQPTEGASDTPAEGKITVEFWHAMGGDLGEVVDTLVARYNESQDKIFVNATFQGTYDDTYNALLASFDSGTAPNIVQNFDLATQTMFDTGKLIPAHQLMTGELTGEAFIPAVRDYYSDQEGMVSMAFNSSTPIVFYNADMFAEAGIDQPAPDWTFSDFRAVCEKLLEAEVTQFCATYGTVGWYFEQILANSGGLYFNNDNGRTARATEVMFNQGEGVETFDFLTGLIRDGYVPNLGNTWTETDSVFTTKQAAMIFDSTAGAKGLEDTSDFTVKTAFIPHSDNSERNGVIIGGAALWLIEDEDPALNEAAWDFMTFMAQEPQQITWHTETGYFPVRTDLQDNAELNTFWDENPNFRTAIDQLVTTETMKGDQVNYAVLGGRAGPFPAIRQLIVEAYSRVLDDDLSAQEALDEAAKKANDELANYNAFFE